MWILFAVLSLFMYAIADLFGKKSVDEGTPLTPIELLIMSSSLSFVISIVVYHAGFGESGLAPWELFYRHPMVIVNFLCFMLHWTLYLLSMKYIKLSIMEAVGGSFGIFYFVGMILFNLILGKFPSVTSVFHPMRLIPIILVLLFIFLYPNVEFIGKKITIDIKTDVKKSRRNFGIGMAFLIIALIFDSLDSLITALIIDSGDIGTVDYIMTSYFSTIIPIILLSIFVRIKKKRWFIPIKPASNFYFGYAITALMASQLYVVSSYFDAVKTGILFCAYPVVPILGAKIILKEKHSLRQNICIWIITAAAIVFCLADYIL